MWTDRQTDGHTGVMKLTVAFRDFANARRITSESLFSFQKGNLMSFSHASPISFRS